MTTQISGDTGVSQCQPNSVSQDDLQSGVVGKGPAFSASAAVAQTLTTAIALKILIPTENYDTDNAFANSTFTAPVAGYYHYDGQVDFNIANTVAPMSVFVQKNGSAVNTMRQISTTTLAKTVNISGDVFLAIGDTLELWAIQNSGANQATVATNTNFSAHLARAA